MILVLGQLAMLRTVDWSSTVEVTAGEMTEIHDVESMAWRETGYTTANYIELASSSYCERKPTNIL